VCPHGTKKAGIGGGVSRQIGQFSDISSFSGSTLIEKSKLFITGFWELLGIGNWELLGTAGNCNAVQFFGCKSFFKTFAVLSANPCDI
jgi:hypothetical protein